MLEIQKEYAEDCCTLVLTGRLDAKTAKDALPAFEEASANAKNIVLDLTDLNYIASAGLRAIKSLYGGAKKQGGEIVVRNVQEDVMDVFEMTGFSAMLVFE